jgi:hypothetical protein
MAGCWLVGASGVQVVLTFSGTNDGGLTLSEVRVGRGGDFATSQ